VTSQDIQSSAYKHNRSRFVKIDNSDPAAVKHAKRIIRLLYRVGSPSQRRWVRSNVRFRELELALAHICRGPLPDEDFGRELLYILACHVFHNRGRDPIHDVRIAWVAEIVGFESARFELPTPEELNASADR
jgi:hypothetical protein